MLGDTHSVDGIRTRALGLFGLAAAVALAAGCAAGTDAGAGAQESAEMQSETAASAEETPAAPAVATVRIVEPPRGAEILEGEPLRVVLAAENIAIVPAGDDRPNSGHYHLFLNQPVPAVGEVIPADVPGIVHLGQGQNEYVFPEMNHGEYTLIAVLGDALHRVLPQVMDTVRFEVPEAVD